MSADNEECDIGLLEAFLREEGGDGNVTCPTSPSIELEKKDVGAAPATPSSVHPSTINMWSPQRDGTASVIAVENVSMAKVLSDQDKPIEKKKFSRQFTKQRNSHLVHKGDTDSSDDEDNKYFEEQNYSAYGRTVKHLLNESVDSATNEGAKQRAGSRAAWRRPLPPASAAPACVPGQARTGTKPPSTAEIDGDPIFGIRIVNPLISSVSLKERMVGRQVVPLANLKRHLLREDHSSDWVVGGVVVSKSGARTSQKGAEYAIWRISDLKAGLKTASVFLFGKCFKELWKTNVGTILGILNPKPLDNRDGSGDEAAVSVDNPQKVMIMGTSKDFGMCKSRKKNGDNCMSFVNTNQCEYCVFHLQAAYKSCSRRMELQSPCAGRGLDKLRNKVLGKNEVFYAGQSYAAVPAKKSHKLMSKDNERLKKLSDFYKPDVVGAASLGRGNKENKTRTKYISTLLEKSGDQAKKDQERLRKLSSALLQSSSTNADSNVKTADAGTVQTKLVAQITASVASPSQASMLAIEVPRLGHGVGDAGIVDLTPPRNTHRERAKLNALKWIHKNGPIRKEDPNKIPGLDKNKTKAKREGDADMSAPKHIKLGTSSVSSAAEAGQNTEPSSPNTGVSSKFQQLLEATSRHMELVEARDNEAQEEYFDRLEKKEKLEDKMLSTYKVPCKAVRCLKASTCVICVEVDRQMQVKDSLICVVRPNSAKILGLVYEHTDCYSLYLEVVLSSVRDLNLK